MLKKVTVGLAALAATGFATSAMAAPVNPWAPGQTTVPVTITVQPMVELFMNTGPVALNIVDAGENQGSGQAVARVVNHIHNVAVNVSAEIDADIANNTQFHILIDPVATWTDGPSSGAAKTLSWRRDGAGYVGATGSFPNQVSGSGINTPQLAFADGINSGGGDTTMDVQYFADSRNVMAAQGVAPFNVVWTIAPQ